MVANLGKIAGVTADSLINFSNNLKGNYENTSKYSDLVDSKSQKQSPANVSKNAVEPKTPVGGFQVTSGNILPNVNNIQVPAGPLGGNITPSSFTASDERMKKIFEDKPDIIEAFSKINAFDFTYKPEYQAKYNGEFGVDNDEHIGVIAQELAENPITSSAVKQNEEGNLMVDTGEMTMTNSAVISELCKRIEAIEKVLGLTTEK